MKRPLFVLLACLFVTMIGFGITLPVLPFYVERLALEAGVSQQSIVLHVGLLTGIYALMQFIFAPLWGRWSDRIGRRPLILIGIGGFVLAQLIFGLANTLWLLYAARIFGGILSSATLPVSAAYVADETLPEERSRGMAWLGTATSLGVVVGPAFGGLLARTDWHLNWSYGHFVLDSFSIPFFAAAFLGFITLLAALRWLPESLPKTAPDEMSKRTKTNWPALVKTLAPLLALALAGQFALTMFESTFALFAQAKFDYTPFEVGIVFVICGGVMSVFQAGAVGFLAGKVAEIYQISAGFALMGAGIALLATAQTKSFVFAFVALLAFGMAFIAPNLAALISKRGGEQQTGASFGVLNAANSLGRAGGPLVGGVLFLWQINAPYSLIGALLIGLALIIAGQLIFRRRIYALSV